MPKVHFFHVCFFLLLLANNCETLSDALKRDTEISNLKGECKRYENMIKVQEATIVNMGQEHEVFSWTSFL